MPPGGLDGCLNARPPGSGDALAGMCGQGHGVRAPGRASRRGPFPIPPRRPALTTDAAIAGAAACPPCALSPAGRLGASAPPAAFRGATAGAEFLAALFVPTRFRPGLAAAAVAFFGAAAVESERGLPFEARGLVMSTRTPPRDGPRRSGFVRLGEALS